MEHPTIPVVEDESIIAKDIQEILIDMGYRVPAVLSSGEEAVERSGEISPDLVLMDILLKGEKDGIEAAGEIRERFGIPVVFLTSFADEATLHRAKSVQPLGYVLKPFEKRALQAVIEIALAGAEYRKRSENILRQKLEELERANKELTQFAHAASHNLQEPLHTILGYSDILKSRAEEEFKTTDKHYLNRIQGAASRMSELV